MNTKFTPDEIVTRSKSLRPYRTDLLPDPDPVLSKLGTSIDVYRSLTSDAHLYSVIQQRKAGVLAAERTLLRQDAPDQLFRLTEFIFDELNWEQIIAQMLNAPLYGMSVLEVRWQQERIKNKTYLLPCAIEEKPVEWFRFTENNELMYTGGALQLRIAAAEPRFIVVRNNPSYNNPYGERALSRCYWPVIFKRNGFKFWMLFTEKYAMPFLLGKQPRGLTEQQSLDLLDKLETMVQDSVAVIPDDSSVSFVEGSRSFSSDAYKKFLEFCNAEISKAVLTETLTTEITGKGSYSAAQTHHSVLRSVYSGDKRLIERSINRFIKQIALLNFPDVQTSLLAPGSLPLFAFKENTDEAKNV